MDALQALLDGLPEAAKDLRINAQSVLGEGPLSPQQRWGVALASAYAARSPELARAVAADAARLAGEAVVDDARAAAALMGMTNVFYRFRHLVGKESYEKLSPRLRMQRLGRAATSKVDLELFALAASAIKGCESCVKSHERVVVEGGLTEEQVNDAMRIASVFHGVAIALEMREG